MLEPKVKKVIWAGILGNALELYDYTLYGYFAAILSTLFFPTDDPLISLMAAYGIYASGFLFRPIGALFFGTVGDKYGRKRALELSILLMAIPTLLIGLLPTYYQIGLLAPILLTLMRFIQGFSVGGELVGSFTFLVEHAEGNQKGFVGSWTVVGGFGGKMIGTFVVGMMSLLMAPSLLESWGWRLPFIGGLIFAGTGYYLRQRVSETPVFQQLQAQHTVTHSPFRDTIREAPKEIMTAIGVFAIHPAMVHLVFIYFPIFMKTQLGYTYTESLFSNFFALSLSAALMPVGGWLSDKIGQRPLFMFGSVAISLFAYPVFQLLSLGSYPLAISMHLLLAAFFGLMHGPYPAFLTELFPPKIRYTASAIAYNICVCFFGGLSPLIATSLISFFDTPMVPAAWLIFCGLVSTVSILATQKHVAAKTTTT